MVITRVNTLLCEHSSGWLYSYWYSSTVYTRDYTVSPGLYLYQVALPPHRILGGCSMSAYTPVSTKATGITAATRVSASSWCDVCLHVVAAVVGVVCGLLTTVRLLWTALLEVQPEIEMVLESSCRDRRTSGWDGEVALPFLDAARLYSTGLERTPPPHVVVVGAHHKTGSEVARKLMSVVCARLSLCCAFETYRIDLPRVQQQLLGRSPAEPIDLVYHQLWRWPPEDIGVPYRFIHFVRHPLRQALSAFRFHGEGNEAFTFTLGACEETGDGRWPPTSMRSVRRFCHATFCPDCCLEWHGIEDSDSATLTHTANTSMPAKARVNVNDKEPPPRVAPPHVYRFMCAAMRPWIGSTSVEVFAHPNRTSAFAATLGIMYFDIERMASLYNLTSRSTPSSVLNVDIDSFVRA